MCKSVFLSVLLMCCFAAGCATGSHGGWGNSVHTELSRPLRIGAVAADPRIYVDVTGEAHAAPDLQSLLTALLQSDAGARLADSAGEAEYVVRVRVLEAGLSDSRAVGMSLKEGVGSALFGTLAGVTVGGAVGGRTGASWGAGIGVLLGLGVGLAENADNRAYVWSMIADVGITRKTPSEQTWESRVAATVDGVNLNREEALPALEDGVAREIVRAFTAEAP